MVPFSFENISRTAALETFSASAVSDAARETHESFKSHLQRTAATTRDDSPRESKREDESLDRRDTTSAESLPDEPIRQGTGETRPDDAPHEDLREDESPDSKKVTEASEEANEEDVQQDTTAEGQIVAVAAAAEHQSAIQGLELKVAGKLNNDQGETTADRTSEESLSELGIETGVSLALAEEPSDGEKSIRSSGDTSETNKLTPHLEEPDLSTANEEAESVAPQEDVDVPQTTTADTDTAQGRSTLQRRGPSNDIATQQAPDEATNAVNKPADAELVAAALDTASDDSSHNRRDHKEVDTTRPIGNATTSEASTTTPGTPSRFAEHLLARTGDPNARGLNISDADQSRFVDRVARAVQATGDRGGTLRLRLSPPELGSLTLEVKVQSGVVSARVEADSSAARSLLLENLPLLRERLAEQGMRVDQFDVDLSDRHAGETPDGMQQNDQQQEDRPQAEVAADELEETPRIPTNKTRTGHGDEQLNVIV
ncbi:MAG: flagellar hook-length control protein FliK [Planctomycetes bacterium]|nr:flagellar hook-length control protein FliK [Planctomycetota bacterium]